MNEAANCMCEGWWWCVPVAASRGPRRLHSAALRAGAVFVGGVADCAWLTGPAFAAERQYSPIVPAPFGSSWYGGMPMCAGGGCDKCSPTPLWQKNGNAAPGCVGANPILLACNQKDLTKLEKNYIYNKILDIYYILKR